MRLGRSIQRKHDIVEALDTMFKEWNVQRTEHNKSCRSEQTKKEILDYENILVKKEEVLNLNHVKAMFKKIKMYYSFKPTGSSQVQCNILSEIGKGCLQNVTFQNMAPQEAKKTKKSRQSTGSDTTKILTAAQEKQRIQRELTLLRQLNIKSTTVPADASSIAEPTEESQPAERLERLEDESEAEDRSIEVDIIIQSKKRKRADDPLVTTTKNKRQRSNRKRKVDETDWGNPTIIPSEQFKLNLVDSTDMFRIRRKAPRTREALDRRMVESRPVHILTYGDPFKGFEEYGKICQRGWPQNLEVEEDQRY